MCILKRVLYCQGQSWESWVMQRTALQYWVCTQKKKMWLQVASLNDQHRAHPSSSALEWSCVFILNQNVTVLCVASAWFLITALRERGGTEIVHKWVASSGQISVSYMFVYFSLFWVIHQTSSCLAFLLHSFIWFICRDRDDKDNNIHLMYFLCSFVSFGTQTSVHG